MSSGHKVDLSKVKIEDEIPSNTLILKRPRSHSSKHEDKHKSKKRHHEHGSSSSSDHHRSSSKHREKSHKSHRDKSHRDKSHHEKYRHKKNHHEEEVYIKQEPLDDRFPKLCLSEQSEDPEETRKAKSYRDEKEILLMVYGYTASISRSNYHMTQNAYILIKKVPRVLREATLKRACEAAEYEDEKDLHYWPLEPNHILTAYKEVFKAQADTFDQDRRKKYSRIGTEIAEAAAEFEKAREKVNKEVTAMTSHADREIEKQLVEELAENQKWISEEEAKYPRRWGVPCPSIDVALHKVPKENRPTIIKRMIEMCVEEQTHFLGMTQFNAALKEFNNSQFVKQEILDPQFDKAAARLAAAAKEEPYWVEENKKHAAVLTVVGQYLQDKPYAYRAIVRAHEIPEEHLPDALMRAGRLMDERKILFLERKLLEEAYDQIIAEKEEGVYRPPILPKSRFADLFSALENYSKNKKKHKQPKIEIE